MKNPITAIATILLFTSVLSSCTNYGEEKEYNGVQLFYTDAVTEAEADALGNYLITAEFADGEKKSVQLDKTNGNYLFRMVVKEGYESNDEFSVIAQAFAADLSTNVFNGSPVEVHLCDENLKTLRTVQMQ